MKNIGVKSVWGLVLLLYGSITFAANDLHLLISPAAISERVTEIAKKIDEDYAGQEVTLVMNLKGAVFITADLMRKLKTPVILEYVKSTIHDPKGIHADKVLLTGMEKLDLKDKHVLLVDDVYQTGKTMAAIIEQLKEKQPKTLKSLAVVVLEIRDKKLEFPLPNYYLFAMKNRYIVGYGIDHSQRYRGLPGIYELRNYD